ncbi:MAG: hypothetical protein ACLR5H_02415 [Oscillospiraceae bacterium]
MAVRPAAPAASAADGAHPAGHSRGRHRRAGSAVPGWYDHVWLRCGIPAGLLALCLLLSTRLWHEAGESLGHGRVTAPAAALVCGLAALADSAQCLFLGQCPNLPFAAPAAALLYLCACGQYRAARARYDSFRLAQLGGTPPYVASVTAAGACKQQGRLEGFYHMWQSPDPAARWQPILTPLYLALATVLALVAALSGHQMNRFLWLWSALLSATVPLSLPLSGTLPLSLLCRRLHKSGCAVAGWRGPGPLPPPAGWWSRTRTCSRPGSCPCAARRRTSPPPPWVRWSLTA